MYILITARFNFLQTRGSKTTQPPLPDIIGRDFTHIFPLTKQCKKALGI